jgi:S-adenosylmethionine synthetase
MNFKNGSFIFTSESVTEGHPDKICDKISDSILDAFIAQDKRSKVALETMVTTGLVIIAGEVTSNGVVNYQDLIRSVIKEIGYDDSSMGFDYKSCGIITTVGKQSSDIRMGVERDKEEDRGQGIRGLCLVMPHRKPLILCPLRFIMRINFLKGLPMSEKARFWIL